MSLRHKKITLGRTLIGENRTDLTALLAWNLTVLFIKQNEPLTLTEIASRLGIPEKTYRSRLSRVLGLMHKKGMLSIDWPTRRWRSEVVYEDGALYKTSVMCAQHSDPAMAKIFDEFFPGIFNSIFKSTEATQQ